MHIHNRHIPAFPHLHNGLPCVLVIMQKFVITFLSHTRPTYDAADIPDQCLRFEGSGMESLSRSAPSGASSCCRPLSVTLPRLLLSHRNSARVICGICIHRKRAIWRLCGGATDEPFLQRSACKNAKMWQFPVAIPRGTQPESKNRRKHLPVAF